MSCDWCVMVPFDGKKTDPQMEFAWATQGVYHPPVLARRLPMFAETLRHRNGVRCLVEAPIPEQPRTTERR